MLSFVVSLPRLAKFDWRVDIKTASSSLSRMAVPTCLMQLQVKQCTFMIIIQRIVKIGIHYLF